MTIWQELGLMFSEMSPWTPILLILGVVLIIIDSFDAGFDFPGLLGVVAIVVGILLRMFNGGTLLMLCVMLLFVVLILLLALFLVFRSAEKGWLSRTALFDKTSAVPFDKTEGTPDYSRLVGKSGETVTMLRPVGKIKIENEFFDAVCESNFINKGATVEVAETEGYRIIVREKQI